MLTSWLAQRTHARAQWVSQQILRRQDLYKEFIEHASKYYSMSTPCNNTSRTLPVWSSFTQHWAKCRFCPRPEFSKAPNKSNGRSLTRILPRISPSSNCAKCSIADQSTCCATSVRPAAQKSRRFALNNYGIETWRLSANLSNSAGCRHHSSNRVAMSGARHGRTLAHSARRPHFASRRRTT